MPVAMNVVAKDGNAVARGALTYDPTRRALAYSVSVSGVPASHVFTMSIDRDSAGRKGDMIRHLAGPGTASAKGTLTLTESERRDLVGGRLSLVVYTREQPMGAMRTALLLPRRGTD
jgi:hypothetical protein